MPTPLWEPDPDDVATAQLTEFARFAASRTGQVFDTYAELLAWSVADLDTFWRCIRDWFALPGATPEGAHTDDPVLADAGMPGATWFPGTSVNYVEQVFRDRPPADVAILDRDETGRSRDLTWGDLRTQVAGLAATLRTAGVGVGDRVVGYLPNCAETVVAFLATASIGAIWSACGMDYAPGAALGRFGQLDPVVLIAADGYVNGGKTYDRTEAVAAVRDGLPSVRLLVGVDRLGAPMPSGMSWDDATRAAAELDPVPVPFDHPLWVLFSSGTTGVPKGIVHGQGGVLLEHLKTIALHCDLRAGDRFWWYTSPSWMMWNFQVAGLLVGATIVCFDGSPAHPTVDALWARAAQLGVRYLGTSPAYLAACAGGGVQPRVDHDLSALHTLGVTGSTLPSASYHWVSENVGERVQIASITGGTDVVTAFAGGAPTVPVWAGEISTALLGVALDAFDGDGRSVRDEVGELVVTKPMPSMPVGFWNDPDGTRYREAYFETFPGVWRHGDWVTITDRGSVVMHGRSDATLNRNGIRMGSADIYAAVEQLPEVVEALVVGVDEPDGGYWMPLFVTLLDDQALDDDLVARIRGAVRTAASPRHVPDEVFAAPGIPHTRTGKKLEIPVKRVLQAARTGPAAATGFDPGSIDDPALIDWFAEVGRRHAAGH